MTTQDIGNTTIKPTGSTAALATVAKGELATSSEVKAEREAFIASCTKVTKRLGLGSLGSLLGTVPAALLVHAIFPVVVVSSVITGGAIACLILGMFSLVSLANTPEYSTEDGEQKTEQERCVRIKVAAEAACDEVLTNARLHENETVFFKDPSVADGKLALCITEVREYKENAGSSSMQRIVARVFSVPSAGEEFAKSPEIAGVGPMVRERPMPSAIDMIWADAAAEQSRGPLPPSDSTRRYRVSAPPLQVNVP